MTAEEREYSPPPETEPDANTSPEVEYTSLSKDGTVLVTRRNYDGRLMLIDANTRLTKSSFKPEAHGRFQLSPTGKELATLAKSERSVIFYNLESWQPMRQTREVPAEITRFLISPDGSAIAIGYSGGLVVCSLTFMLRLPCFTLEGALQTGLSLILSQNSCYAWNAIIRGELWPSSGEAVGIRRFPYRSGGPRWPID